MANDGIRGVINALPQFVCDPYVLTQPSYIIVY